MLSNEEKVAALYAQRQQLLKKLSEINLSIRALEQLQEKAKRTDGAKDTDDTAFDNADSVHVSCLLDSCVQDSNGLRDAMKMVDTCKAMQENMTEGEKSTQKRFFRNSFVHGIIARASVLMLDPNGSELLQHALGLFKNGGSVAPTLHSLDYTTDSPSDISEILLFVTEVKDDIPRLCQDTNGTRVMQRLFDHLKSVEEVEYCAKCFADSIIPLSKDINGSHTIARLLASARPTNFTEEGGETNSAMQAKLSEIQEILYKDFAENCVDVCKNRQGCCIIQKCLQWAPEPYFSSIIDTVLENTLQLVHDPFGNYVVQFILEYEKELSQRSQQDSEAPNYTNRTIRQMLHNIASLSCNKFSSNVIEKCLKIVSSDVRQLLVDELTDPQVLPKLLTDSYANYVIQTAIATSSEESQFIQLRDSIMPLQKLLKNSPYGVKVETKLTRRQRDSMRKQKHQKHQSSRGADASHVSEQAKMEGFVSTPQLPGMQTISPLVGSDTLEQHRLALSSLPEDMSQLMTHPQYVPLMFSGQQTLFGLQQDRPSEPFQVNMVRDGVVWGPQHGFALFQQPNQRGTDRQL